MMSLLAKPFRLLPLSLLLTPSACADRDSGAPPQGPRTPATHATAQETPQETAPAAETVLEALRSRLQDDETVFLAPAPAVDAVGKTLAAQDIRTRPIKAFGNLQYLCQQLTSKLRRDGSLWLVYAIEEHETALGLREYFLDPHRKDFDRRFEQEGVVLVHVLNEIAATAKTAARIGFDPVTQPGWMVTDIECSPDGSLLFFTTLNGIVKWQRVDPKTGAAVDGHGEAYRFPLLKDGHEEGLYIGGESGLVGLAVSPDFAADRTIYVHANRRFAHGRFEDGERFGVVSAWTVAGLDEGEPTLTDERILLRIPQLHDLHNAGAMEFGPDGMLYIAVGDGTITTDGKLSGRAPADTFRGKILRIDPSGAEGGKPYRIPRDNPFVDHGRIPPETYAWGFRNPWRIAFASDGRLVAGDVGEDRYEKITFVEPGRHHGWPYLEGLHPRFAWPFEGELPVLPIHAYDRGVGMSVTGGFVYEGEAIPWLRGKYVFGDFLSGRIWAVDLPPVGAELPLPSSRLDELGRWPMQLTTLGKHPSGELYVAQSGRVFLVVPHDPDEHTSPTSDADPLESFSDSQVVALFGGRVPAAPREEPVRPAEVALGRALYHDETLFGADKTSCATCHPLDGYGVDGEPVSPGANRNAPSTYNAAEQFAWFWDYRSTDFERAPLLDHALAQPAMIDAALAASTAHDTAFAAAYPDAPKSAALASRALAAFLRSLETRSRWDAYLDGDRAALVDDEKRGLAEFLSVGCASCHQYRSLGAGMPQKLGLFTACEGDDKGRGALDDTPDYFFKVPALTNVAKTAPYYHDGSIATLEESVRHMASVQLGRTLDDVQVRRIVTFLESLTGEPVPASGGD